MLYLGCDASPLGHILIDSNPTDPMNTSATMATNSTHWSVTCMEKHCLLILDHWHRPFSCAAQCHSSV